ncbi:MAG: alpha-amylase family glycosyl hydrolase [Bacillaceae bacterium]
MTVATKSKLSSLLEILQKRAKATEHEIFNYTVPDLWNCFNYSGKEKQQTRWGEMIVNPFHFYAEVINSYILPNAKKGKNYSQSASQIFGRFHEEKGYMGGDWIKKSAVYSMMVRTSTAWDHDRSGELEEENLYGLKETGTFVKSLALLPLLKKMGLDVVYMLPISKYNKRFKKGELGSPYAVMNFFEIDPELKDPMTGDAFTVEDEFQAFVEACHMLDMKVFIDVIPRTNARENDFILENPEWFYWIHTDSMASYYPPSVPGVPENTQPDERNINLVYQSGQVWNHIRKFTVAPNLQDKKRWNAFKNRMKKRKDVAILSEIEQEFGVTIAPAFSDHINDPQPPWSDVTFFRLYLDHPNMSKTFVQNANVCPYILFDTIKGNIFKGDIPNQSLWDTLSSIIPYYQQKFGIDGARIDMGHALPSELVHQIISKARTIDPDFCFIAEELYPKKAWEARENGYNMIIGKGFYMQPRIWEHQTHNFMYESRHLPCPVFAGGETHDTPRLAAREGGRVLSKMLSILNMFMPNGVPFVNSGQECYETQPMNTGLDCRPNEAWSLWHDDPYNGKLALFDKYVFHYTTYDRWDLADALSAASHIRQSYIDTFANLSNFVPLGFDNLGDHAIGFGWRVEGRYGQEQDNVIIIVANTDVYTGHDYTVHLEDLRAHSGNTARKGHLMYSPCTWQHDIYSYDEHGNLHLFLQPGEVQIIWM